MYRNEITLSTGTPNFPLKPCWVGDGSAALFIFPDLQADITGISVLITGIDSGTVQTVAGTIDESTGTVYCAGWLFPGTGTTQYEVILYTADPAGGDDDIAYWAGKGILTIMAASMEGIEPTHPAIIPENSYARDPATGLYHLITATTNSLGEITLSVADQGVSNV